MDQIVDKDGNSVRVGSKVKVLEISSSVIGQLDDEERSYVLSMIGEVFDVYEIDEHGQAWVEKWWNQNEPNSFSHSLGLFSQQIQIVS